jgi:hypothetical protein
LWKVKVEPCAVVGVLHVELTTLFSILWHVMMPVNVTLTVVQLSRYISMENMLPCTVTIIMLSTEVTKSLNAKTDECYSNTLDHSALNMFILNSDVMQATYFRSSLILYTLLKLLKAKLESS